MATVFFIGHVWDHVNLEYVRPRFRFDGNVIQAALGEIFVRVDVLPGSHMVEMITEGYTFDEWGTWEPEEPGPFFDDVNANPTGIHSAENCYYFCYVHPAPDPLETEFVETYRGVDIFQYLVSGWYTFTYAGITYSLPLTLAEVRAAIDAVIDAVEEPTFIEVYRGYEIWRRPDDGLFFSNVTEYVTIIGETLEQIRVNIDTYITSMEDPALDPGPILEQLMTWIMNWVTLNLEGWLAPVYDWITAALAGAHAAWTATFGALATVVSDINAALTSLGTEMRDRWDTFSTLTLPSIWDTITSNAADAMATIDLKGTEMEASMDAKLVDFVMWVEDFVKLSDPYAFLKDPVGFITTAFNTLIAPHTEGIIKSFKEGFEEGQETG